MKLVLSLAGSAFVGPALGLAVLAGLTSGSAVTTAAVAATPLCMTSGPVPGLDATQASRARTIVATAQQVVSGTGASVANQSRAELISLMTAYTESTMHNYANPKVPASQSLPNDGNPASGGDLDSVGLFQQRTSWGPLDARMDPQASTRLFVQRLLGVPAWATVPPGVAAQAVQVSAFPERYAQNQASAQAWLDVIQGKPGAVSPPSSPGGPTTLGQCGADGLPKVTSPVDPGKLPPGYTIPANATDSERTAVTFALAQLGKPYVFAAAGPNAYDCSGLTMAAWAAAGVQLTHYTVTQYEAGSPVADASLLSPGNLIFIPGSGGSLVPPNPQHVGMYIGAGYVVEAPQTGDVVKIVPLAAFTPVIGMRHYG
jgi:cell wall-associated NlpC family hydrolase